MTKFEMFQIELETADFLLKQMLDKIDKLKRVEEVDSLNLPKEFKDKYINQQFEDYHAFKQMFDTQGNLIHKGEQNARTRNNNTK